MLAIERRQTVNRSVAVFSSSFSSRFVEMTGIEPVTSGCKPGALPLSYIPAGMPPSTAQWAYLDSNQGPQLYQSCALAN